MKTTCRSCRKQIEIPESPLGALAGMVLGIRLVVDVGHPLLAVVLLAACTLLADRVERWIRSRCSTCTSLADCIKKAAVE